MYEHAQGGNKDVEDEHDALDEQDEHAEDGYNHVEGSHAADRQFG